MDGDPLPITVTDHLLEQVRDELRTLNASHEAQGAELQRHFVQGQVEQFDPGVRPPIRLEAPETELREPVAPDGGGEIREPAHGCDECGRVFASKGALTRHKNAKHGSES